MSDDNSTTGNITSGNPQAGANFQPLTTTQPTMMVARYFLDIEVDPDSYFALTQAQRKVSVGTILGEIYCLPDMGEVQNAWAQPHQLVTVGFDGVAEAAYADARRRIEPYIAAGCSGQPLEFPSFDTAFDGVSYEIHNGRRRCVVAFALASNGMPAVFKGPDGLLATVRFRCHIEPVN